MSAFGPILAVVGIAVLLGSPRLVRYYMSAEREPERYGGAIRAWIPVLGFGVVALISGVLILAGVWSG